jgi:release factor glutamine methyltransferase
MNDDLTVAAAIDHVAHILVRSGIDHARLEARLLVAHALGQGMEAVIGYPERPLAIEHRQLLARLAERRSRREPAAYILGQKEFWSLPFEVGPATLIPRPESETVIETVLHHVRDRTSPLRVLDLGTGSGCLLLTLLKELPAALGVGVDSSQAALCIARRNAERLGVGERACFLCGNWADAIGGRFDVVVANPPYLSESELAAVEPEIACFEPRNALFGGTDGLDAFREIIAHLPDLLAAEGAVFLEVGNGQGAAVSGILAGAGLQGIQTNHDFCGIGRCVWAIAAWPD